MSDFTAVEGTQVEWAIDEKVALRAVILRDQKGTHYLTVGKSLGGYVANSNSATFRLDEESGPTVVEGFSEYLTETVPGFFAPAEQKKEAPKKAAPKKAAPKAEQSDEAKVLADLQAQLAALQASLGA